jgi:hypothetical protein
MAEIGACGDAKDAIVAATIPHCSGNQAGRLASHLPSGPTVPEVRTIATALVERERAKPSSQNRATDSQVGGVVRAAVLPPE